MLLLHQAILILTMKANLLCPMQLHHHGVFVNDEPKFMALNPTKDHNAIVVHDEEGNIQLRIPLAIKGATTYFPSRVPTRLEYEQTPDERIIDLTDQDLEWDPQTTIFEEQEAALLDSAGNLREKQQAETSAPSLHCTDYLKSRIDLMSSGLCLRGQ
jgi:hypothetical protein